MGGLRSARTYGIIGSLFPLVGTFFVLVAVRDISDEVQEKRIFTDMLIATVLAMGGIAAGYIFYILDIGIFPPLLGPGIGMALWILSSLFLWRSYSEISFRLGIDSFRTAAGLDVAAALMVGAFIFGAALTLGFALLIFLATGFVAMLGLAYGIYAFYSIRPGPYIT
jgi:uncharacterized membrane protein